MQLVALQQRVEHVDAQLPLAGDADKLWAHARHVILDEGILALQPEICCLEGQAMQRLTSHVWTEQHRLHGSALWLPNRSELAIRQNAWQGGAGMIDFLPGKVVGLGRIRQMYASYADWAEQSHVVKPEQLLEGE